jgi:histidinol dehydrogenase
MTGGAGTVEIAVRGRLGDLTPEERSVLLDRAPSAAGELTRQVAKILEEVQKHGDDALRQMARRYDGVELKALEVPQSLWKTALGSLDPRVRGALERAARNIRAFHEAQVPAPVRLEVEPGVLLERRWSPLSAVGVYAPGGTAAYPSSVLMGVVPARAAGVEEIVVCSPPGPEGRPPDAVLAAAAIGGATRVFALGGAGAVGALAFGTESVPRVSAIVGPGNRWVTEAKRQVAGDVLIDSPAGPSEVLVVADETADPGLVALELVAQAEHDADAAVALVTPSPGLLEGVEDALAVAVGSAPRQTVIRKALSRRGGLILTDSMSEALDFAREYGAEHLALFSRTARDQVESVSTAGTVFLGEGSTVAFGDYLTGANHVLPTAGLSASFSGLSVTNFLRSWTVQELTPQAAEAMAEDVALLAEAEGLPGHASAARARLSGGRPSPEADSRKPSATTPGGAT